MNFSPDPASFDMKALDSLRELQMEGEPDVVKEIVEAYLEESAKHITNLQAENEATDWESMGKTAHSLKSISGNVGAMRLSELSRDLEMKCKQQDFKDIPSLLSGLMSEYKYVQPLLSKEIGNDEKR